MTSQQIGIEQLQASSIWWQLGETTLSRVPVTFSDKRSASRWLCKRLNREPHIWNARDGMNRVWRAGDYRFSEAR